MPRWLCIALIVAAVPLAGFKGCTPEVKARLCPPLQTYSAEFRAELAKEYAEVIRLYPHVAQLVRDYNITRDDIRACLKHR
jgi:hypothetical protein